MKQQSHTQIKMNHFYVQKKTFQSINIGMDSLTKISKELLILSLNVDWVLDNSNYAQQTRLTQKLIYFICLLTEKEVCKHPFSSSENLQEGSS